MVLAGKVGLVTGASRGIGAAIAVALAENGADVVVNHLAQPNEASHMADSIKRLGHRALVVEADVADLAEVERMVGEAVKHFGRLDIAVANAVYCDRELFYEAKIEGVRRTVDVTMWGAFNTLRAAAQQMIAGNVAGSIVMIGSPHAWIPSPKCIAYNMSKAAVVQMARTAALELAPRRIRVNIVHPGWTDTPGERKYATDEQLAEAGSLLPFGRLARPDEIARGVVFLCDPASEYITGSELSINGGSTLPWWDRRGEKPAATTR